MKVPEQAFDLSQFLSQISTCLWIHKTNSRSERNQIPNHWYHWIVEFI